MDARDSVAGNQPPPITDQQVLIGTIEAIWRIESAKIIARLARIVRDVGVAEELAQDALIIAMEQWPHDGVPHNPAAWIMTTAKHRAIDRIRRNVVLERKVEELGRELVIEEELAEIGRAHV